ERFAARLTGQRRLSSIGGLATARDASPFSWPATPPPPRADHLSVRYLAASLEPTENLAWLARAPDRPAQHGPKSGQCGRDRNRACGCRPLSGQPGKPEIRLVCL